ncbi:isomerizing glutamine--fructose-6-phosphate transaminase [Nanoarchaeota archaeon]
MCGIIAYKGKQNANEIVLEGLKQLEYRGYDSWGIASLKDSTINIIKKTGKIGEINKIDLPDSNIAISHTRWATHGSVTELNAHPHISQNNKIAVVHNGIIENYQELRKFLENNGLKFKSETDTEIIPQYIEYLMDNGKTFEQATIETLRKIEGSFAIVAICAKSDKIIGARRGSPLVFGLNNDEFFIASDVPAFLKHTNKVIYLDDDEYIIVNKDYKIHDLNTDKEKTKEIKTIDWTIEQAKKGNYPHFMLKEISEQKFTIKEAIEQNPELIEQATKAIKEAYGVFFVGCGTSYHACVSASYLFSKVAKKHINVVIASEFRNYQHFLTDFFDLKSAL